MAIIPLRAWYLERYEPVKELEKRPHDLRLNKQSMLRSGLRADFLDEVDSVRASLWFDRYMAGEAVEFYVEGSGCYEIANIDLIGHEMYFVKRDTLANLEPKIFLCSQRAYPASSDALRETMEAAVDEFNERSRIPLEIEESPRPTSSPVRLNTTIARRIRRCLLFVADVTPIASLLQERSQLLPSPTCCVELGYALQSKRAEQILLVTMERPELEGELPFDLPKHQHLWFRRKSELERTLPDLLETMLQRFALFSSQG